jgi:hypothetical protein
MRRRECFRVQEQMERWEPSPPDWAQAHIKGCPRCAEAWQWEQRYRRARRHARHAPVPACSLPWERVQAQLAARAVRQRTLRWRFAFATTFATGFAIIALIGLLLVNTSERGASPMRIAQRPPSTAPITFSPPRDTAIVQMERSVSSPPVVPRQRETGKSTATNWSRPPAPPMPRQRTERTPQSQPVSLFAWQANGRAEAKLSWQGEEPDTAKLGLQQEEPVVALLPLPSMSPESGESADYLPVQYGGDASHAYSF